MQTKRLRWPACMMLANLAACGSAPSNPVAEAPRDSGAATTDASSGARNDGGAFPLDATATDAASADTGGSVIGDTDACIDGGCAGDSFDGDPTAIFVAPSGADTAPGTMAAPVHTIAKGVSLAQAARKDVYVCDATYAEAVTIATTAVGLHGGHDCARGWAPEEDRATIAPPAGTPITVQGTADPLTIEAFNLVAPTGVSAGDSSIAALVASASSVAFHHVSFTAGVGANGADGASATASTSARAPSGATGASVTDIADCAEGVHDPSCTQNPVGGQTAPDLVLACEGHGGRGGDGANLLSGVPPVVAQPGGPGDVGGGTTTTEGVAGQPGALGSSGAVATGFGALTSTGYTPTNAGAAGGIGGPGGGGGGGAGGLPPILGGDLPYTCPVDSSGAGGEGGYGGCGGAGGQGGGGGGASIGLVSFESSVNLTECTLSTGTGGDGGNPGAGAPGELGGYGGIGGSGDVAGPNTGGARSCPGVLGMTTQPGFIGGNGGRGGQGGPGGPGGGGPSVGIAWTGVAPAVDATVSINIGSGGQGGVAAASGPDGAPGMSAAVYPTPAPDAGEGQ